MIYQIISGCFNALISAVIASTTASTAANSEKACAAKKPCSVHRMSVIARCINI